MKILFIGDIFGQAGRRAIKEELPLLIKNHHIDCVIANAENTTHGKSLSLKHYHELISYGINYFTFGNHTWHIDEMKEILKQPNVVRPLNLKTNTIESQFGGVGSIQFKIKGINIRLTNLLGRILRHNKHTDTVCLDYDIQENPFPLFTKFLNTVNDDIHIVDFHAETTSEKNAFLLTFAGKVGAILGTHTHVQSADEKIYKNTAYITDVGMTGGSLGVIGAESQPILNVFMGQNERFKLSSSKTPYQFNAVLLSFNNATHNVTSITRIYINEHS